MASTTLITDLKTAAAATPTAATVAKATAAAGPIGDVQGLLANALLHAQELKQLCAILLGTGPGMTNPMLDSGDPISTTITGVAQSLV